MVTKVLEAQADLRVRVSRLERTSITAEPVEMELPLYRTAEDLNTIPRDLVCQSYFNIKLECMSCKFCTTYFELSYVRKCYRVNFVLLNN